MEDYKSKKAVFNMAAIGSNISTEGFNMGTSRSIEKLPHKTITYVNSKLIGNLCDSNSNNHAIQIPTNYNSLNYDYDQSDQSLSCGDSVTLCRSLVFVQWTIK